jgi:hypothetical protein
MYKPRAPQTVEEHRAAQKRWADYSRMRLRPKKQCRKCREMFPNNDSHFARGDAGTLRSTCLKCDEAAKARVRLRIRATGVGTRHGICPICEEHGKGGLKWSGIYNEWLCQGCIWILSRLASPRRLATIPLLERLVGRLAKASQVRVYK